MIAADLLTSRRIKRVLCLGAHSDDIEIGCGGTLLKMLAANPPLRVTWVVLSASNDPRREAEAQAGAAMFLKGALTPDVRIEGFRDGFFPYSGGAVKEFFETLKPVKPDVVFTHYGQDKHQDHRGVSELTWNTFRDQLVLEYEIPKFDGNTWDPNAYVVLDEATCRRKIANLMRAFGTQRSKRWFTEETFRATLRMRGIECAAASGYAEGFVCRKVRL
jgi:LmbE family N-acetylglucosaminyl deacetylase